jgi:DNA-binding transcriptional MerR regulator
MDPLSPFRSHEFTLADLVSAAAGLCAQLPEVGDERVRALPDERTLRYYQSSGLLDRPVRYEGRNAIYGFRHLLQAVAVKALQGQGLSLAQVQGAMAGAGTGELESAVLDAIGGGEAAAPERVDGGAPFGATAIPVPPVSVPQARPLIACELAPGVVVTLDPARVPQPEGLLAILAQALRTLP